MFVSLPCSLTAVFFFFVLLFYFKSLSLAIVWDLVRGSSNLFSVFFFFWILKVNCATQGIAINYEALRVLQLLFCNAVTAVVSPIAIFQQKKIFFAFHISTLTIWKVDPSNRSVWCLMLCFICQTLPLMVKSLTSVADSQWGRWNAKKKKQSPDSM